MTKIYKQIIFFITRKRKPKAEANKIVGETVAACLKHHRFYLWLYIMLAVFSLLFAIENGIRQKICSFDINADRQEESANIIEKYTFEALPINSKNYKKKRIIEMEYRHFDNKLLYTSKMSSFESYEIIKIKMTPAGKFILGVRNTFKDSGKYKREDILIDGDKVYVKRESGKKIKVKEYSLHKDKPFAVDATLLVMMRKFPFNKNRIWKVFMVDFSQHSIVVTVRNTGTEKVVVPAGTIDCYRMEVKMNLIIFRPKIIFWIAKEKPHYLVRHAGRRGPFTSMYSTSLISKN